MKFGLEKARSKRLLAWIGISFFLLVTPQAIAANDCDVPAGRLVSVEGSVEKRHETAKGWLSVGQGDAICVGDFVHTGRYSRAGILIDGADTLIRLDENTTFQLVAPEQKPRTLIDLLKGAVHFISRVSHSLEIRTPFVSSYIDGTEFLVQVGDEQTTVVLYEGDVLAKNEAGSQRLTPGQAITARKGQAPSFSTVIRPRDAVQWTLHYPHIFSALVSDSRRPAEEQLGDAFKDALNSLHQGFTDAAFKRLDEVPHAVSFTLYHIYRAGLLLTVGRVEEADKQLARALKLKRHKGAALSLKSLIALSRNEKQQAMDHATQAVAEEPNSAVAHLALSYVQQAHFDLDGALASSRKAVELAPSDPYSHARLAELLLSTGDLKGATTAAQQAVSLDAEIALGQTMLGFAHLTRIELDQAKAAFQQAAALDQSDPLPRLGLGLALIRQGQLEQGRRELEVATLLDPQNALARSYMGKAYYEERRDDVAASQYDMAKELDPNDPTPWFYEAILKYQQGQPVEALHSLQTSKELNDNRGVYRSRLMLDEDQATRSANLGRIYRDLNFEHLAVLEGRKSLATDQGNHSAHRLLADTYSHLPRHEMARVSELLQAQLLQPINISPVQPSLADTNLFIPDGAGPSAPSFNEYGSLFNRNRVSAHLSSVVAENDTFGEEIVISGVSDRISYSLGQYHYETDGFRDNNEHTQDIYMGFIQGRLSEQTSVQAELRSSERDFGDLRLRFHDDNYMPFQDQNEDMDSLRLGLLHAFNPSTKLIASAIYTDLETGFRNTVFPPPFGLSSEVDNKTSNDSWLTEVRLLKQFSRARLTFGASYAESDIEFQQSVTSQLPFPPFTVAFTSETDTTSRQTSSYAYSWLDMTENLTLVLGASVDDFDDPILSRSQLNPKLGFIWQVTADTVLRAASFRTLYRNLATWQTIEPTEVAGFNQLFFGTEGEDTRHTGVAIDHSFNNSLHAGYSLTRRKSTVPYEGFASDEQRAKFDDRLGQGYLYWTPTNKLAVAMEYIYERTRHEGFFDMAWAEEVAELNTHRFPLTVSWFTPSGMSASLTATYVEQDGLFSQPPAAGLVEDEDRFWVVDARLNYRLPKRQGMIGLQVRNLFDEEYNFQNTDRTTPTLIPERYVSAQVSLAF